MHPACRLRPVASCPLLCPQCVDVGLFQTLPGVRETTAPCDDHAGSAMSTIPVHRLTEAARPKLLDHFLRLDTEDIRLRFGSPLGSDAIAAYVQGIDFDTDARLRRLRRRAGTRGRCPCRVRRDGAELGVSVLPGHRSRGLGSGVVRARGRTRAQPLLSQECICIACRRTPQ